MGKADSNNITKDKQLMFNDKKKLSLTTYKVAISYGSNLLLLTMIFYFPQGVNTERTTQPNFGVRQKQLI